MSEVAVVVVEGKVEVWKWYCRICGAEGEELSRADRDRVAGDHIGIDCICRVHRNVGWAEAGHLVHVWKY